jgi:hypothetical protein
VGIISEKAGPMEGSSVGIVVGDGIYYVESFACLLHFRSFRVICRIKGKVIKWT